MDAPVIDLSHRVAMVTGGSRGIGRATAKALAAAGAAVGVGGRDEAAVAEVVAEIDATGGKAIAAPADCTDADAVTKAFTVVATEFGPVDVLAAFAGGNGRPHASERVTPQEWRSVIESDLTSAFLTIHAALPGMLAAGKGSIVTMSSAAGRQPSKAAAAYAAAKAGVAMLSRHLAAELGPRGIRVNCLAPSAVQNDKMTASMTAEQLAGLAKAFPLGRIGQPADVATAAAYLLSDAASWVTGVTLDVTGGRIIV